MGLVLKKALIPLKTLSLLYCWMTLFIGCGSSDENKVNFAISEAEIYLNNLNCTSAINVLEAVGNQSKHSRYLQTLASAYACKASHSTLGVFSDLNTFGTKISDDSSKKLGWLSIFSTASLMTSGDDIDFLNLQNSIDTLLYAGALSKANNPSIESRAGVFSTDDALDINVQLFYMLLDQLSRYTRFYGCYNGDSGIKGQTRASPATCTNNTNECFANYSNVTFGGGNVEGQANIGAFLSGAGLTGGCQARDKGHPDLSANDGSYSTTQVSSLCEGVVLMNNLRVVLDAISASLGSIQGFEFLTTINNLFTTAEGYGNNAGISTIMGTLSKAKCEAQGQR